MVETSTWAASIGVGVGIVAALVTTRVIERLATGEEATTVDEKRMRTRIEQKT